MALKKQNSFTVSDQRRATSPDASVWVSANAGSGKTYVLTRRVIRLLLDGAAPSSIVCLTFTKAAAAEMKTRIFDELARWTQLENQALRDVLFDILGHMPLPSKLDYARTLFAASLETPGGLRIQTIHSFCENLLHQFSFEANIASHFQILDDQKKEALFESAFKNSLRFISAHKDTPLYQALDVLLQQCQGKIFHTLVKNCVFKGTDLFYDQSIETLMIAYQKALKLDSDYCEDQLLHAILDETFFTKEIIEQLEVSLKAFPSKRNNGVFEKLEAFQKEQSFHEKIALLKALFFKKTGEAYLSSSWVTKDIYKDFLSLETLFHDEVSRLKALFDLFSRYKAHSFIKALLIFSEHVWQQFNGFKQKQSLLDFDDLIIKTCDLFRRSEARAWVHYKIDQNIVHLLVDEAQDTSPRQWQIIQALTEQFFVGEGVEKKNSHHAIITPTLFAVGDMKQSIYSFNGADPKGFVDAGSYYAQHALEGQKNFEDVRLLTSFRSTPAVLQAVDAVFKNPILQQAVTGQRIGQEIGQGTEQEIEGVIHEAERRHACGRVEVWPLFSHKDASPPEHWASLPDKMQVLSPLEQAADAIAQKIRSFLDHKVTLSEGKLIQPSDILILVRKRGSIIGALNRALRKAHLPIAGADRLALHHHAVMGDLLCLFRFLLQPYDELSLAELLKSPFIGFDDDMLFKVAYNREGTLWQALRAHAQEHSFYKKAVDKIEQWLSKIDFLTPYQFLSELLYAQDKRVSLLHRLGADCDDILNEILNLALTFERQEAATLQGFLAFLEATQTEIKRDLENTHNSIRIMTVHSAKGLEAPIVFMADSNLAQESGVQDHGFIWLDKRDSFAPSLPFLWAPQKELHFDLFKKAKEVKAQKEKDEYWRLLYVAMTRARDQLYIVGCEAQKKRPGTTWYEAIRQGLEPLSQKIESERLDLPFLIYQDEERTIEDVLKADIKKDDLWGDQIVEKDVLQQRAITLKEPFILPPEIKVLQPSQPIEGESDDVFQAVSFYSHVDQEKTFFNNLQNEDSFDQISGQERGTLIHSLLHHLVDLEPQKRSAKADIYLKRCYPHLTLFQRISFIEGVVKLLQDPHFAFLFEVRGFNEVPLMGEIIQKDGTPAIVSARLDRLVVQEDRILIIDYKTGEKSKTLFQKYCAQLALYAQLLQPLYPQHILEGILLWVEDASFDRIDLTASLK